MQDEDTLQNSPYVKIKGSRKASKAAPKTVANAEMAHLNQINLKGKKSNVSSQGTLNKSVRAGTESEALIYGDDYSLQANSTKNINLMRGKSTFVNIGASAAQNKGARPTSSGSHALLHEQPTAGKPDQNRRKTERQRPTSHYSAGCRGVLKPFAKKGALQPDSKNKLGMMDSGNSLRTMGNQPLRELREKSKRLN